MSFLDEIVLRKVREVEKVTEFIPLDWLRNRCASLAGTTSLREALVEGSPPRIIAEIKRASPSKGILRPDLDAGLTAQQYMQAGAAAISVLTDGPGFQGGIEDLVKVRGTVNFVEDINVPVLRKDFIVHPYQVWEARGAGADAVLLIVAALGEGKLTEMMKEVGNAGMEALVEVHDEDEMQIALDAGAQIVGINNRNLHTFEVDPEVANRLAPMTPDEVVPVVESGIKSPEDVKSYMNNNIRAFLVGEALVTAPDPGERLKEFLS